MSTLRVVIRGALSSYTGYGSDGIGLARALVREGVDVHLMPTGVRPPLPPDVVQLLCKDPAPPFDVGIVHLDPMSLKAPDGLRRVVNRLVAWTMWEFPEFRPVLPGNREGDGEAIFPDVGRVTKYLSDYDLLLAYDATSLAALRNVAPDLPTKVLQGGYESEIWPPQPRDWFAYPTRFCMVGQLHERKDPFTAIEAFNVLRDRVGEGKVELHLKTGIRSLHPKMEETYPGLRIHQAFWPHSAMLAFYQSCHAYVAPSRGEGKNLPALEAQSTGMPVIATAVGGHRGWLSPEYAYVLRHEMVDSPGGPWAQADVGHLADLMQYVHEDREDARRRGELASRAIPAQMDWSVVVRAMLDEAMRVQAREVRM